MGTRADFYAGIGKNSEWLGSIAWDGYPEGVIEIFVARSEQGYRQQVLKILEGRDDATTPGMGWPWPWDNSKTTDYAYAFDRRHKNTLLAYFGEGWYTLPQHIAVLQMTGEERDRQQNDKNYKHYPGQVPVAPVIFPNMSARKNVALDEKSGVIFLKKMP